ncbi:MAG: hypothetical protein KDC34_20610 [Saprospiraceae bacterium]|nr:hypothetical protein [Saprospiraceae bacterium]
MKVKNINFNLKDKGPLSRQVRTLGIYDFSDLFDYVACLPYGRNTNRSDLSLVLKEKKGTCSSKHAFLKAVAEEQGATAWKLVIGIYKMHPGNTPGIGNGLVQNGLEYIPEAHCYLKYGDQRFDLTRIDSDFSRIAEDVLVEEEIQASQVDTYKVSMHQQFIKNWVQESKLPQSFEEIWTIRESCIQSLSENEKS